MNAFSAEIDLIIASQNDWRGDLLRQLRETILEASPSIVETVKWKMPSKPLGSATWESNGIVCVADYLKSSVRLTFPKGAGLNDSEGFFNSRMDSKVARAIDYFESSEFDSDALKRMVQLAIELNSNK
ncbi:MAG: hypothetical protein RIS82_505 [Actinomycetota bacterium]|jgi:hypothetical protein